MAKWSVTFTVRHGVHAAGLVTLLDRPVAAFTAHLCDDETHGWHVDGQILRPLTNREYDGVIAHVLRRLNAPGRTVD
jgi:hypothetical protein